MSRGAAVHISPTRERGVDSRLVSAAPTGLSTSIRTYPPRSRGATICRRFAAMTTCSVENDFRFQKSWFCKNEELFCGSSTAVVMIRQLNNLYRR